MRSLSIYRNLFLLVGILFLAGSGFSQDLGSSNKLFGGGKPPTTSKKTAKKTSVRNHTAVSKPKASSGKRKAASKTARASHPAPNKMVPKKAIPGSSVSDKTALTATSTNAWRPKIVTGSTRPRDIVPTGRAADDLYEKLIEEGNTARDEREYTTAEIAYRHAQSIKANDSRAIYGLGNLYGDQMRWEDAEEAYRKALEIEPRDATAYIALSFVLTQPVSAPNLADRYEEAEKLARQSIKLAPSNSFAFDQLGVSLELRGLIGTETENAYRTSIKLDPGFALAYAHLGRLLRRRGKVNESTDAYRTAIRQATEVSTMVLVAEVMQSEQRYAESELLLRRALAVDPRNPAGLLMLGRALTALGSFTEAENVLKSSLAVTPNGFIPNSLLASLYVRQSKFEYAENALLQATRFVSPNEKRSLSLQFEIVGDGYLKGGKARSAERAYRQAISLDGGRESLSGKLARAQHG